MSACTLGVLDVDGQKERFSVNDTHILGITYVSLYDKSVENPFENNSRNNKNNNLVYEYIELFTRIHTAMQQSGSTINNT